MTFLKLIMCVLLLFGCLLMNSCSTTTYREVYPILMDGKYDSEFPYRGCSAQLEEISGSVKMISCIAYYKNYVFPLAAKVRLENLHDPLLKQKVEKEVYLNQTASGSATVILCENKRIALLTCAHVVDFSDTVITYYHGENNKQSEYIQSIAVKDRQTNYIGAIPGVHNLEILCMDNDNDIALMGQVIDAPVIPSVSVFNYPIGKAKELEWGAFVYLFGYPAGYRVVTKAIVSNPNRDKYGAFLTDAVFNRGFSGGIVLAVRDGVPNFELVGMMKLVPGYHRYYLTPAKEGEQVDIDPNIPYKGDMYAESRTDIIYGVAPAIPAELIVDFLQTNQQHLARKGYDVQSFIERPSSAKPQTK